MSGLVWGIKRIDPDLTTGRTRDGAAVIHWPVQTGGWVEHPTPEKVLHGDTCGVGIHVAKTWRGASLGGSLTEAAGIVVGWHPNDVVAESADKARVRRCLVVPGVTPFPAVVRNGWCARAYLAWANLTGAYLTGADLTGADLSGANLAWADLTGADLTGADLSGANLTGAYLTGADLTGADLSGAYLTRADLTGADLTGANLTWAYLTRANLTGAADLTGANLARANLTGADLTGATGGEWTRLPAGWKVDGGLIVRDGQ